MGEAVLAEIGFFWISGSTREKDLAERLRLNLRQGRGAHARLECFHRPRRSRPALCCRESMRCRAPACLPPCVRALQAARHSSERMWALAAVCRGGIRGLPTEHWIPTFAGMADSIKFGLLSTLRHSGQAKREPESSSLWAVQRPAFHAKTALYSRPVYDSTRGGSLVRSWSSKRPPRGNRREYYRKFSIIMISDSARSIWDQAM